MSSSSGDGESVRVAVRVRPFNQRELDRSARLVISMNGPTTSIEHPDNPNDKRSFTFDFSYWSHDAFTTDPATGSMLPANAASPYADQRTVFNQLGADVLNNAYQGYNSCLFAYGQTGSGKSYSMVGYGSNKGIVPITCDEIFKYVAENRSDRKQFHVVLSMMEIYNEQVRDLLIPVNQHTRGGLKVRHHPQLGVQVVGLSDRPVSSYREIERAIDEGTKNRTIAATNMNATSSRAHTIVQITFTQIEKDGKAPGKDREIQSRINLVDLAGSERADSTGATGDRLKEGSMINLSLTMLGNVINALASNSNAAGSKKKVIVPYRDSKLTMILQDALGGNSKTIMICALSPADINYDETLSTLRYADRAKQIKNRARVNVDPTELLIRQLREENEKLKKLAAGGGGGNSNNSNNNNSSAESEAEKQQLLEQLREQEEMMRRMQQSWQDRLDEAQRSEQAAAAKIAASATATNSNSTGSGLFGGSSGSGSVAFESLPHLSNLNEDDQLSRRLNYAIGEGETIVGSQQEQNSANDSDSSKKSTTPSSFIQIRGLGICAAHVRITRLGRACSLELAGAEARCFVNGAPVTFMGRGSEPVELHHHDRILLGSSSYYVFVNPLEQTATPPLTGPGKSGANPTSTVISASAASTVTWEQANREWAAAQGFRSEGGAGSVGLDGKPQPPQRMSAEDREYALIQDELVRVLPLVHEANLISQELDRGRRFEAKIISHLARTTAAINANEENKKLNSSSTSSSSSSSSSSLLPIASSSSLSSSGRRSQVCVKVRALDSEAGWMWSMDKFMNRVFLMREMYQDFLAASSSSSGGPSGSESPLVPDDDEHDPFWDPVEPQLVGHAVVYLTALGCRLEIEDNFPIQDYKGKEEGILRVEIHPCLPPDGRPDPEGTLFVEDPNELLGQPLLLRVRIPHARGLPSRTRHRVHCRFAVFDGARADWCGETKHVSGTINPDFGFEQLVRVPEVTPAFLAYLQREALVVDVYGTVEEKGGDGGGGGRRKSLTRNLTKTRMQERDRAKSLIDPQEVENRTRSVKAFHRWRSARQDDRMKRMHMRTGFLRRKVERLERAFVDAQQNHEVVGRFLEDLRSQLRLSSVSRLAAIAGGGSGSDTSGSRSPSVSPVKSARKSGGGGGRDEEGDANKNKTSPAKSAPKPLTAALVAEPVVDTSPAKPSTSSSTAKATAATATKTPAAPPPKKKSKACLIQ